MEQPSYNNVYGLFSCPHSLEEVAKVLTYRLGLNAASISVRKSQFDGTQKMHILSARADFEAYKLKGENEYLLSGSVAGTAQEVYCYTQELQRVLNQSGYPSRFEIYDEDYNCIGELA
jgi:hypothetical protein